ncbi:MAG: winged helix-turn-helix domain-containing protein, partial [Hyphomicrobiaceae bacterium]|nr:winged helix-turn-helix domain-containing protein [Hyphomicrobiaceae bacterium]
CRLAEHLLRLGAAAPGPLRITHAELAARVGTAREVISRRLDAWARRGLVKTGRGTIEITDTETLRAIAEDPV